MAVSVSEFQVPEHPNKKYKIEVKHKPAIPDNVDHWKVFDDDKQINRFMEMSGEFENVKIDQENMFEREESVELAPKYPNEQYEIEVRHKPAIPDNVDHWQVFDDDKQINRFMEMSREFENVKIDQENMFEKEESQSQYLRPLNT